jgi:hypothetical protein
MGEGFTPAKPAVIPRVMRGTHLSAARAEITRALM